MFYRSPFCNLFLFTFLLLLSSCSYFYAKYYTEPNSCLQHAQFHKPYDVVIIPGFPYHKDSMNFVIQNRVYWALYLYQKGFAKNFIFSGSAVYTPYVEAKIMAMYAQQIGIPAANIFIETQAEHSTENIYYSYRLAEKKGFKTIVLATEVAQSSFIKSNNDHRTKFVLDFIPIVYDSLMTTKLMPDIDQDSAFVQHFVSLPDRENGWKRLKGTKGKKVRKMMKAEEKSVL